MKKCIAISAAVFAVLLAADVHAQNISRLSAQFLNFNGTETTSTTAACGPGAASVGITCPTPAVPGSGGILVYNQTIFVPFASGPQTLYVTISAVGDNHSGESNFLSCNVDGPSGVGSTTTVCNPTPTVVGVDGGPGGWVTLTHHFAYDVRDYDTNGKNVVSAGPLGGGDGGGGTGDMHDNDYYYTWCKPVRPGTHTVNLRLGNHSGPKSRLGGPTNVFFEKAFIYIDVSDAPPFGACTRGRSGLPAGG
jgi:hypothetical protein